MAQINTVNSDACYIVYFTDDDESKYIYNYRTKLKEDGEGLTHDVNKLLEAHDRLNKEGLMCYKQVIMNRCWTPIYTK